MTIQHQKWIPSILCAILIAILSLYPGNKLPDAQFSHEDLFVHVTMYSGFALTVYWAIRQDIALYSNRQLFLFFLLLASYGASMELLQKWLPIKRSFSWLDIMANMLGASLILWAKRIGGSNDH